MATQVLKAVKNNGGSCSVSTDPKEKIAALAYQYYVDRGYQDGRDQEDWLKAETVVRKQKKETVS